ncbi:MAG: asparagine synthase (glutamine-hydrolyzing), partial [Anaerolineales bacterium]|nr:asparagine synthase (glutamine-hydrolyzing) [Anaerolineales bacterium]
MTGRLKHRGPDDDGFYQDAKAALGMRRLSIIDLETGGQPIANERNDIWVIYNGELYNFRQLRRDLEKRGHLFKTQTDTEVIIHAYEEYGDRCVEHFNGMFAIALWDTKANRLWLARDRVGIKPLYYWTDGATLVFGSELKALVSHPDVPREIDPVAVDLFLSLEYIPAPRTIYAGVRKLLPGHTLSFDPEGLRVTRYWEIPHKPIIADAESCAEQLKELLFDAVKIRLMSDVPLGAFSSGGIDSTAIIAYMDQAGAGAVKTFSIGFQDDTYNELPDAEHVAQHFGTEHHFRVLNPDILDLVEELGAYIDEPFADTSVFPTYLVSKLARESVTVVLSGDGGDELFGGYDTYVAEQLYRYYAWLPASIQRGALPAMANLVPPRPAKKGMVNKIKRMIEGGALDPALQHTRWMIFMNQADKQQLYQGDLLQALGWGSTKRLMAGYFEEAAAFDPLGQQQYVDIKTYLADDILTKVDRMSMAASLEARVPFLDHRLVEFAINLPPDLKVDGSRTKVILRRAVRDLVPERV